MKTLIALICLLSASSTVFASCPRTDNLKAQKVVIDTESKKLTLVADYLNSRILEKGGAYENSQDVGLLMVETRTKALRLTNQSAQLQMQISDRILKCIRAED